MEAKEKKAAGEEEGVRLLIKNGPRELCWLFSLSERSFITLTLLGIDEIERKTEVCIDGIKWKESYGTKGGPGPHGVVWNIWGHFGDDGKTNQSTHSDSAEGSRLWGDFSGEYDMRTRLGHMMIAGELGRRLIREQEEREREDLMIKKYIESSIDKYIGPLKGDRQGLALADEYIDLGVVDIINSVRVMAKQDGLVLGNIGKYNQFVAISLKCSIRKDWPSLPGSPGRLA